MDKSIYDADAIANIFNIEAEQTILGNIINDNLCLEAIQDRALLQDKDFYTENHQLIFATICSLIDNGRQADVITIADELEKKGLIEKTEGVGYLVDLATNYFPVATIEDYAKIIHDLYLRRELKNIAQSIAQSVSKPKGSDVRETITEFESKIYELTQFRSINNTLKSASDLAKTTVEHMQMMFRDEKDLLGISYGYKDIDSVTSGMQGGQLIIIAGRPGMGKSSFAINVAENIIMNMPKMPVLIFTLEMSSENVVMRMLSSMTNIQLYSLMTGKLTEDNWAIVTSEIKRLQERPLYIDDAQALTPHIVGSRARRLSRQLNQKLGLIVIDYLQLMHSGESNENRAVEVSNISRNLKQLSRELDTPIIALSQLNRGVESRTDRKPNLGDLRESGAIEQDADVVMLIYRDDFYNKDSVEPNIATINIAKNRNGPAKDNIKLAWLGPLTSFRNLYTDYQDE